MLGEEFWRIEVLEIEIGVKRDRVWVCRLRIFEVVEEGVEGEEGWLKAGGLSSKAGPRPAA